MTTVTLELESFAQSIIECLLHPTSPCSVNAVVPPGFGDQLVGDHLIGHLRSKAPGRAIADITMDEVPSARVFVERLAEGFQISLPAGLDPDAALAHLLRGASSPGLYVLRKFHRTLDALPSWLLAHLRTAEQAGRARALVIAHASHTRLRRRWQEKGHPLIVSEYGDTHALRVVRLLPVSELRRLPATSDVPGNVLEYILAKSGGYPDAFDQLVGAWRRKGSPAHLGARARRQLAAEATRAMLRLADWLDDGSDYYRRYIVDLRHHHSPDEALEVLRQHELYSLLVQGGRLRAGALADAVCKSQRDQMLHRGGGARSLDRARVLYLRSDYASAHQLLGPDDTSDTGALVLRNHAKIMSLLVEVEHRGGTDWSTLEAVLSRAVDWRKNNAALDEIGTLGGCYDELYRVVQVLGGVADTGAIVELLRPQSDEASVPLRARALLLVLVLCYNNAVMQYSLAEGLQCIVGLPEKIFRVWAWWRLGLDYERAPSHDREFAEALSRQCAGLGTGGRMPAAGEPFTEFRDFAYYAVIMAQRSGLAVPMRDGPESTHALRLLEDARAGRCTAPADYFALCRRWLDAMLAAYPFGGDGARHQLLPVIESLPLYDGEIFDWSRSGHITSPLFPPVTSLHVDGLAETGPGRVPEAPGDGRLRVLHLSDFHFSAASEADARPLLKRLLVDITRDRGLKPDLIIVTGDIAQNGREDEYALASAWFRKLLSACGLGPEHLVLVAGNHDVDRGAISRASSALQDELLKSKSVELDREDLKVTLRRTQAFTSFVTELGARGVDEDRPWAAVRVLVRGWRVHVAALCSAWLSSTDADKGKLPLGLTHVNAAFEGVDDVPYDLVIAALHHPWSYLPDWDDHSRQEIHRSADVVLRGHLHDADPQSRVSPFTGTVHELAAGSAYQGSKYPNSYYLIEFERSGGGSPRIMRIWPRGWAPRRRDWGADLSIFNEESSEFLLRAR